MGQYRLVAMDMDGTLLDTHKRISERNMKAVKMAADAGITIVISTGRCPAEMKVYPELLNSVHYLDCLSGALVCDNKIQKRIYENLIYPDLVMRLIDIAGQEGCMIQLLTEESIVQYDQYINMSKYNMGVYQSLYKQVCEIWPDIIGKYNKDPFPIHKLNLYHTSDVSREKTVSRIINEGLPVTLAKAETTSLEISAGGTDKGVGLSKLCDYLGITMDETIVVGDAENDTAILKQAGLAVVMGNAKDHMKELADIVAADCDHDGCAEVIERFIGR